MTSHRSRLQIYIDMLSTCREILLLSEIARKCNLSHYDAVDNLNHLTELEMMKKNETTWQITEYGLKSLELFEEVNDMITPKIIA